MPFATKAIAPNPSSSLDPPHKGASAQPVSLLTTKIGLKLEPPILSCCIRFRMRWGRILIDEKAASLRNFSLAHTSVVKLWTGHVCGQLLHAFWSTSKVLDVVSSLVDCLMLPRPKTESVWFLLASQFPSCSQKASSLHTLFNFQPNQRVNHSCQNTGPFHKGRTIHALNLSF